MTESPVLNSAGQRQAREAQTRLHRLLDSPETPRATLLVSGGGETLEVELSPSTLRHLETILGAGAQGQSVTVLAGEAELSPHQAAELLGVSRPFLTKLLDEGKIPFRRVGTHRRIRAQALEHYARVEEARQLEILTKLQAQAQELGMGY